MTTIRAPLEQESIQTVLAIGLVPATQGSYGNGFRTGRRMVRELGRGLEIVLPLLRRYFTGDEWAEE